MEEQKYSLATPMDELEKQLLFSSDAKEIKDIVDIFNLNLKKKDIVRASKLNELQDKVFSQMEQRLDKKANDFSNKDLLDYFKTIQDTINKSDTKFDAADTPTININKQQVNVQIGSDLSRDSKKRVIDAIKSIVGKVEKDNQQPSEEDEDLTIDGEYSIIEEQEGQQIQNE